MKTNMKTITSAALLTISSIAFAQRAPEVKAVKKTMTVLNIDSRSITMEPVQMGNLVRLELEKLDTFDVMDRYDVAYVIEKNKLSINNCYGKLCLVEVGNTINTQKMLTGSAELFGETIIITLRQIDVKAGIIEKTQVMEFLNLPKELQSMVAITIRTMYGLKNDENLITRLTKKFNYENATNNPTKNQVNLSGPRMGVAVFTGHAATRLRAPKNEGGYSAYPAFFQFGYQFEKQYLNEGDFQALFEVIPLISGLDQGQFIPSITLMNGLRNNKYGWEFAFGPTFGISQKAYGYYDNNGAWHRESELTEQGINPQTSGYDIIKELDSRGATELSFGFIFALGKTFKSGKLNIPVNAFIVPSNDGLRFGASFGFNAKKNEN